jgi:hypothetical protein
MMDKTWRPEDWTRIKQELEATPNVWGTAIPYKTHAEQIIEATATRILEEFLKLAKMKEPKGDKEDGQTYQVRDNEQTNQSKESV